MRFVFWKELLLTMMFRIVFKTSVLTTLWVVFAAASFAQPAERKLTRSDYIEQWKDEAISQMHEYGIPASITLAQGILESGDGNSALARYANNHFGIKCHGWDGQGFYADDDKPNECFRKYGSAEESFRDHSVFLKTRGRYSFLFDLKTHDYKGWARGLKKAGYATNPKYPDLLIRLIEQHNLDQYDKAVKMPKHELDTEPEDVFLLTTVSHQVNLHDNNIKFVVVQDGDTYYRLAKEFKMDLWQIYKYNDLTKEDVLTPGDIIYLQPKRRRSKAFKMHKVQDGETMRQISQRYGVKLKRLYQINNMRVGAEPYAGQELSLHKQQE